jgi:tocopherol O-methyltransferase
MKEVKPRLVVDVGSLFDREGRGDCPDASPDGLKYTIIVSYWWIMICIQGRFEIDEVAAHYDELDPYYREIWGEHVHHGLWLSDSDPPYAAARQLVTEVATLACLRPGDRVCDVGCGYGATARMVATEYGATVSALTVSRVQYQYALNVEPRSPNPTYLLRDWLDNGLEAASFDAVIAIESSEHMQDLTGFFSEVARVLRPGGRFVVCAWLSRETPCSWERRWLLEPICREGRLRGIGSASEYHQCCHMAGLVPVGFKDVSKQVKRTWSVCTRRVVRRFFQQRAYREFLLHGQSSNRLFALTLFRIWLAYELGSMRYGILSAVKPASVGRSLDGRTRTLAFSLASNSSSRLGDPPRALAVCADGLSSDPSDVLRPPA